MPDSEENPSEQNKVAVVIEAEVPLALSSEEQTLVIEEVVTRKVVESVISDHSTDLDVLDFSAEQGSQVGDNYMSVMYAVNIQVRSKSTGERSTVKIMLKTMPKNNFRQHILNDMKAFEKEGMMYSRVFKDFEQFQRHKGLDESEIFHHYPKCYSWYMDGKADYLAMEDLRPSGFRMGNRVNGLDLTHCEIVIRNLAKFHAISYAMFLGDFDKILETYPFLEERMFKKPEEVDDNYKNYMSQTFSSEAEAMRKTGHEVEAEAVMGVYDDQFYTRLRGMCADKVDHAVINHGDCWTNNLLFRYDEKTRKPVEFRFIDFQISRVCSRAIDLHYFLYSSPQMEILNREEEKLLRLYHEEFTSFAAKLGCVNENLTWENLLEEMDQFRAYGITLGLMLSPMFSADKSDIPDMESLEIKDGEDNTEVAAEFISSTLKSDMAHKKILNIAQRHIPRCSAWNKFESVGRV